MMKLWECKKSYKLPVLLAVFLLLTLFQGTVFASATISVLKHVAAVTNVNEGEKLSLYAVSEAVPKTDTLSYQWYRDNVPISGETSAQLTIDKVQLSDGGTYDLHITNTADNTKVISSGAVSVSANTGQTASASGGVYVTAYTVQNAAGAELQRVQAGEKCQIVVALRDDRFSAIPTKLDAYGNIANAKITSTSSFASPTFGDIRFTTPSIVNGALEYAVIFNDISYLGGEKALEFDIAYNDTSVPMQNVSVGISQMIETEKTSTTNPIVMVSTSSYGGANVAAGSTFDLYIGSYNTSSNTALVDVMTSISLPPNLILASGSNVVLHKNVAVNGTFGDNFTLQAQSSTPTGVENITVNYTYYVAGTDTQLSSNQIITVAVEQPDRFSFTSFDMPPEIYVGEDSYLTVGFVNKGKGILYNLSAEITGSITNKGQVQYLGNLESGTQGSVDFVLNSSDTKNVSGEIVITYEDINGVQKTQSQPYSYTPVEMNFGGEIMTPGFEDFEQEQSDGMPDWLWGVIIFALLFGIASFLGVSAKKRRDKIAAAQLELEDDDDEDI